MSAIEKELLSVTKIKPEKYDERQDMLAAIIRYAALDANNKSKISDSDYDNLSDESVAWIETGAKALDKKKTIPDFPDKESDNEHTEGEGTSEELDEEAQPTHSQPKDAVEADDEGTEGEQGQSTDSGTQKVKRQKTRYDGITGEKDKYGIIVGTKSAEAIKMFEKGRTMAQVTEAIEGTYYNLLRKLVKEGHLLEKLEGSVLKLTHKDSK